MTKKRKSSAFTLILAVIAIVLLVQAISTAGDMLFGSMKDESVKITVSDGMNSRSVAQLLKENGVIKNTLAFEIVSNMKGADKKYHAGEFEIHKGSGYIALINGLTYNSGYTTANITVPEGSTLAQIADIAAKTGYVGKDEFMAALGEDYDYEFLSGIKRENKLEGYLFPDTYNISNTMSARDIINLMLKRFGEVYKDEYSERARSLGYSDDEIVTLASVIEAEAASDNDRPLVSGVFHNRLKSKTYPYLESCATVQYILGERKAILSNSDIKIKSPYNTYINKGLPAGPICSPGKAAIEAALYPADTDYMFFQSDADGKIYYAKTLEEHEQIRRRIQQ